MRPHNALIGLFGLVAIVVAAASTEVTPVAPPEAAIAWPSFRGARAEGIASDQKLPTSWNGATGEHVKWKVRVPGLAHSSPIVWDDRVFVATAVSSLPDATFKPGLYGDGDASADKSSHKWTVIAYDRKSGKTLWERVAFEGPPVDKRHVKST